MFPTVDLKMSHQLGNDDGSSAPGSFLDFRPHAGENEERPPSGDPTGQVNQSFGKFIDSVNFTLKNSTMTLNPSEVTGYDMVLDIGTVFCFSLQ